MKFQQGRHQHWVMDELADNSLYLVTATKWDQWNTTQCCLMFLMDCLCLFVGLTLN